MMTVRQTKDLGSLQHRGDEAIPVRVAGANSNLKHSMMYQDHPYAFTDKYPKNRNQKSALKGLKSLFSIAYKMEH